jgi:hypothetical protein
MVIIVFITKSNRKVKIPLFPDQMTLKKLTWLYEDLLLQGAPAELRFRRGMEPATATSLISTLSVPIDSFCLVCG